MIRRKRPSHSPHATLHSTRGTAFRITAQRRRNGGQSASFYTKQKLTLHPDPPLQPVDVVSPLNDVGILQQVLEQGDGSLDASHDHLGQGTPHPGDRFGAVAAV